MKQNITVLFILLIFSAKQIVQNQMNKIVSTCSKLYLVHFKIFALLYKRLGAGAEATGAASRILHRARATYK
jgi:hypothetical protein